MTRGDIVPDRFVATRSPWPSRRTLGAAASTTIRTVRPWGLALALAVVAAGMGALWQMQGSSERAAAIKAVRPDSFESLRSRLGGAVTASDIRLFLNATPSAPDRAAAIARLESLDMRAWRDALAANSREAYAAYLRAFPPDAEPKPMFAQEALERMGALAQ